MGPRKKSKLDDKATASESETPNSADETDTSSAPNITQPSSNTGSGTNTPKSSAPSIREGARNSWYGGSWRSKASPVVAQVARENVGVSRGSTQELPREQPKRTSSASSASLLSRRRASKGTPIAASMTKVHATSGGEDEAQVESSKGTTSGAENIGVDSASPQDPSAPAEGPSDKNGQTEEKTAEDTPTPNTNRYSAGMSMFKSWWSRPDGYESVKVKTPSKPEAEGANEEAQRTPLPGTTPVEESKNDMAPVQQDRAAGPENAAETSDTPETVNPEMTEKPQPGKSWFWSWTKTQNTPRDTPDENRAATDESGEAQGDNGKAVVDQPAVTEPQTKTTEPIPQTEPIKPQSLPTTPQATSSKSSGWAFWSKDTPTTSSDTDSVHKEVGELAVADTPSQSNPEAAQFNDREDVSKKSSGKEKSRPKSLGKETLKRAATNAATMVDGKSTTKTNADGKPIVKEPEVSSPAIQEPLKPKKATNILLPDFKSTYQFAQTPSVWQKIRQYLLGGEAETPHLHLVPSPPRIKKALAIGVHGFFPSPLIRTMIGQPTGTSIRFSSYAANAISEWTQSHGGYSCDIEKIALEGEGFISDRVDTLWKLLLNWIEHIRNADFIMIACHSQGVPVAIMLIAKLIAFGCLNSGAKIGVCAMAGINLGPFVEYKTRYFGNTAAELFQFSNPKSPQFTSYLDALKEVLKFGVKLVYVGSLDDQLVSLESSTFANISHPYIYRAVFVDGKLHAPDFITHLVGFVLKLRNLGLPDHGLIHELSPALAGSLYTGEGHSRIHEDPRVYSLAVYHALETTNLPQDIPLVMKDFQGTTSSINPNPYFLPWAMRGLLEEEFVKRELGKEVDELLSMFEEWRPTSKALKDVRFRLEAVRSKL